MALGIETATLRDLQARYPSTFVACPYCAAAAERGSCTVCLGTCLALLPAARRYFADRGLMPLADPDAPDGLTYLRCVRCAGAHLLERCPDYAGPSAELDICVVCGVWGHLDENGRCEECEPNR